MEIGVLLRNRCNFFGWLSTDEPHDSIEDDKSAQPDLNDQEILESVQEEKEGIEGIAAAEEAVTSSFTQSKKITILRPPS